MPIGRRKKPQHRYEPRVRINKFIRVPEVRVISSSGEQLGVMKTREAQNLAQEEEFDLVEVAPNENPPVCRIMDFGKYLYDEKKKKRDSKRKQTKVEIKECKFRPKIGDHDFDVRIRRAVKFLATGNKVKLTVMFKGREHAHPEIAERLLERAFDAVKDLGKIESQPKKEGRDMHCLIIPLPEHVRKKALKARGISFVKDTSESESRKKRKKTETELGEPPAVIAGTVPADEEIATDETEFTREIADITDEEFGIEPGEEIDEEDENIVEENPESNLEDDSIEGDDEIAAGEAM